jgi:hypothetical protein
LLIYTDIIQYFPLNARISEQEHAKLLRNLAYEKRRRIDHLRSGLQVSHELLSKEVKTVKK